MRTFEVNPGDILLLTYRDRRYKVKVLPVQDQTNPNHELIAKFKTKREGSQRFDRLVPHNGYFRFRAITSVQRCERF